MLGLLIMQYPQGSPWERVFGWRFIDPWEAVEPYARGLPDGEMLVVLSHVGLSLDTELAKRVPRIDLLLGGHSHDTLEAPRYVGDVPIVHAGPYGRFVSRSELGYDAQRRRFTLRRFHPRSVVECRVKRVLFVTNGHGEAAIAERIAHELGSLVPGVRADHLGLVGETRHETMNEVGPRRSMPSGGLIAMGNCAQSGTRLRRRASGLDVGAGELSAARRGVRTTP